LASQFDWRQVQSGDPQIRRAAPARPAQCALRNFCKGVRTRAPDAHPPPPSVETCRFRAPGAHSFTTLALPHIPLCSQRHTRPQQIRHPALPLSSQRHIPTRRRLLRRFTRLSLASSRLSPVPIFPFPFVALVSCPTETCDGTPSRFSEHEPLKPSARTKTLDHPLQLIQTSIRIESHHSSTSLIFRPYLIPSRVNCCITLPR
jgi:hypothetical protein